MDWMNCNYCFSHMGEKEDKSYYVTNCGHIFCNSCLDLERKHNPHKCLVCKNEHTEVPLTNEMQSDLKDYFMNICDLQNKTLKVIEFQSSHLVRFLEYTKQKKIEYSKVKETMKATHNEIKNLQKRISELDKENKDLKKMLSHPQNGLGNNHFSQNIAPIAAFNFSPKAQSISRAPSQQVPFSMHNTQATTSQTVHVNRLTLPLRKTHSNASRNLNATNVPTTTNAIPSKNFISQGNSALSQFPQWMPRGHSP